MQVWLVTPAWRRFAVTSMVLAQRAWLAGELAARGVTCHTLIVADDLNLDIARQHGFDTLEVENTLGRRVNAGFRHARTMGADYVAFIGSDDWLHPDLFEPLLIATPDRVIGGHDYTIVDLERGRSRRIGWRSRHGVPPWFLPAPLLEQVDWRPVDHDDRVRGIELGMQLKLNLGPDRWEMHDPFPLARVDFKTHDNMSPYDSIAGALGVGPELDDPWADLADGYPLDLVDLAHNLHLDKIAALA